MAVKLKREVGNTGIEGEHWAPCEVSFQRDGSGKLQVTGVYRLWLNAKAHREGKEPLRGQRVRVRAVVGTKDPKLSQLEAALDKAAVAKTVEPVRAMPAVEAQEAIKADPEKGIKARGAIQARPAVEAVQGQRGGPLEGGEIA